MRFAVVDLSKQQHASALELYAAAQQRQLREHYASAYDGDGANDEVIVLPTAQLDDGVSAPILLHPHAPSEGALGVHDRLPDGRPVIHVYLDLATRFADPWPSIASHEVLETRADPRLHACVELDDGSIWDREICDRVEADSYLIDNIPMSNFNTPACFEPSGKSGEKFDWMGLSVAPNQVRAGGYAQRYRPGHGWTMVGAMRPYRAEVARLKLSRSTRRLARPR